MKCWHCNTELIWGSDFDGADYGCEEEYSIVEVYLPKDTEN